MGTVRITNAVAGKTPENTNPLGAEIEFDGQNYFIGPNDRIVIADAGHAAASASAQVDIDDGGAVKYVVNSAEAVT